MNTKPHKGRISGWWISPAQEEGLEFRVFGTFLDHPGIRGDGYTSCVVKYDTVTGEIETKNSRYTLVPPVKEKSPALSQESSAVTFSQIRAANVERANAWHQGAEWTTSDWACAVAEEAGEVCGVVKRMNRLRDGVASTNGIKTMEEGIQKLGKECADTFLYMDLLLAKFGLRWEDVIPKTFNDISIRESMPHRIVVAETN